MVPNLLGIVFDNAVIMVALVECPGRGVLPVQEQFSPRAEGTIPDVPPR
jgi:hypothetical protein